MSTNLASKQRNTWVDFIKGVTMITVIMYHIDIHGFIYLGVNLFFVINGFFITRAVLRGFDNNNFSYIRYLKDKILRIYPLILIAGAVSLFVGFFLLLPNFHKLVAEYVVASNFFGANFLEFTQAGDYWSSENSLNPMMHMWYMGIMMQFAVIYPLILMLVEKLFKKSKYRHIVTIIVLTIISSIIYILNPNESERFYFTQYRVWEFTAGGLVAALKLHEKDWSDKTIYRMKWITMIVFLLLIDITDDTINGKYRLFIVIFVVCLMLTFMGSDTKIPTEKAIGRAFNRVYLWIAYIGEASMSVFIWHQIFIAFYRYSYACPIGLKGQIICSIASLVISLPAYKYIEQPLIRFTKEHEKKTIWVCIIGCLALTAYALNIYRIQGVVRDVPEAEFYVGQENNVAKFQEYVDRVYDMDDEFADDDRIKVFVTGHSYCRDWVNVLLSSDIADKLDISYRYSNDLSEADISKISKADYLFMDASYAGFYEFEVLPDFFYENMSDDAVLYGIGSKKLGNCMGNVYSHRFRDDYYSTRVTTTDFEMERNYWGDKYIDFTGVITENGKARVFTDDKKLISFDCLHLTPAGAKYYTTLFDLKKIFGIQ